MNRFLLPVLFSLFFFVTHVEAATVRELYESAVDAYNQQRFDDAINSYQQILKEAPNFAPAYVGLGLTLKAKGASDDEVVHYYNQAVEHDPSNLQALEQLGRLYYALNQFDKAEKIFLRALKINPSLSEVKQMLAWVYLVGKGKPELAIKYFKAAGQTEKPDTMYGMGMAYFSTNQRVEAMDMMMQLRAKGQDEYAKRLEQSMRDNKRVVLDEPQQTEEEDTDPNKKSGIKVRLRGKLSQAD